MSRGKHLIGKVLGSCELEKLLGYGGSSAVFLAQQHVPERKVAVKVFLPRTVLNSKMQRDFYQRFLREAEAASRLDHPHILPVYSYGEENGIPYIVMPYMPGGTLAEYILRHGPLSLSEAQWYLEQIASALDYAHAHGYVHCDVKPANILLDSDGRVMLSDFGIAYIMPSADNTLKKAEVLMATPDYLSPEQALGHAIDGRSDVYSLGITLFYMLAKRLPFTASSTLALALMHVHEAPPSLALIRADISPLLDRVMHKALEKEPGARFQTAGAFSAAFTDAIAVPDKAQAATTSGKRAAVLAVDTDEPADTSQPMLLASEPLIRVRPVRATMSFTKVSLISGAGLLLLLFLTVGYVLNLVNWHPSRGGAVGTLNSARATPGQRHLDQLTEHDKWPGSKTFFYDNRTQSYHILNDSARNIALALYNGPSYSNFSLTVNITQLQPSRQDADYYGIVFRADANQSRYYLFEVFTRDHAEYVFSRFDNEQWSTLASGYAPELTSGLGKKNIITVSAAGDTFGFSINGKPVAGPIIDSTQPSLRSGLIGLCVEDQGAEVAFSHLSIMPRRS